MQEIILKINKLYNIQIHSTDKVEKGFLSENYILTDISKKYFLKRYRFNIEEKIIEIHTAKQYFADGGIPVILPILNNEQKTYFYFEGGYFALFPFIDGSHIERDSLTETATISLGEMLGKIHLRGKESTLPRKDVFTGWDKEKLIARADQLIAIINEKEELNEFDRNALEGVNFRKKLIESNTAVFEDLGIPSNCLIHGDYHDTNIFFDDSGNVEYVFDFEKVTYAPRVFELVRSMIFMFFDGTMEKQKIALARLYIESYSKIYPISKEELQAGFKLFYLRQLHGFWVETEHYINKNYRVDHFLSSGYKSAKYLSENLDELVEKLLI